MTDMAIDTPAAAPTGNSPARIIKHKRPQIPDESVQLPWVEKYRPERLEDLVAHEDIISILTRLIDNDNLPHLLLYGPPGTGKVRTYINYFYRCRLHIGYFIVRAHNIIILA